MPKWTFASLRITNQTAFDWSYAATHDITVHKSKGINGTEHLNFDGTIIPGETKEVQLSAEHQYGKLSLKANYSLKLSPSGPTVVIQIENDGPLQVKGWLDISDEQIVEYGIFHLKQEVTGDPITKQDGLDADLRKPLEAIFTIVQRRSKFHVASVSVPSLHPVLNAQEFSPEFSHPFVPIWRAHQDTKTSVPVTIDIARAMTFVFALDRVVIPSTFNQKGFALKVDLLIDEKLSTHLLHVESISSSNGQPTIVTTSVAIEWDKRAPKAFIGSATFYAVSTPGNQKIGLASSNVEIYAISRPLPSYLSHNGIHREFLRLVVPSFRNEMVQSFQDYTSYASDILHNHTGMVYDIYGGGSSHYSQIDRRTVEGTFNLSRWVSRRRLLRPENNNLAFHVNCFDQAGIVQIALSLGILDKEQGKLLAMTYLRPFGFIKETHLVGWGPCNNPLPRVGDGLVVPQDSPTRQPFGSHMFISYDGNVVDATCGPTYIHFTGLQGYLNKAIDRTTKCYSNKSWPAERDDAKLFLSRLSGGLVKDARGGAGITKVDGFKSSRPDEALSKDVESFLKQLGLPARIEADDTISKQGHEALSYGQLTEALKFLTIDQMGVTVQEEKPMREPGGTALLTWIIITAEKDPQLRVVYLRIYVCPSETIAAQTMEHYLSDHLHGYKDKYVREKTGKSFGRRHLVSSPHNQSGAHLWVAGRLAIVLTGLSNSEALRPIADVIQDFLDMPLPPNKTGGLGPAKVSKGDQVMEVGEVVEVSVNVKGAFKYYATYRTGSVFLLNGEQDLLSGDFKFRFLARRTGEDIVSLSFTDSSFFYDATVELHFTCLDADPIRK